ncbi:MAG: hypothetical protein ABIA04_08590 [Pseudomonadota bacterium]
MNKVLFTTVQKPFGLENEHVQAELFHAQVTRSQGIFSLRSVYHGWNLEFMAKNINAPTTVLHYPSEKEFIKELKKDYDYLGIGFVLPTWDKAKRLIELTRLNSPNTKIILGGYGTVLSEVDEYADFVCRGEGLSYMKELLNEPQVTKFNTPTMINEMSCLSLPVGQTGVIFGGLGCPNGCDFCCTSHFFKKKHIPLLKTGKDIFEAMKKYDSIMKARSYSIIDEDFLKDKTRIKELYEYTSKETDNPRTFSCFASAKSIMQYDPEWLVELGVDTIWLGVESKYYSYDKTAGIDLKKLFDSLHEVGINTLGSMILGVDHHDSENIQKDIDYTLSLKPSLTQFLIFSPCPETPLYKRLDEAGTLTNVPYAKQDGFHLLFKHPNFTAVEIEKIQLDAFKQDFEKLGPSALRFIEKTLLGYRHFKNSNKPIIISRFKKYKKLLIRALPLFPAAISHATSVEVKKWVRKLRKEVEIELSFKDIIIGRALAPIVQGFALYTKLIMESGTDHMQPKTLINRYNYKANKLIKIDTIQNPQRLGSELKECI